MTHPLTPHEKVRQIVDCALNSAIPEPWEVANHATDAIITALASGSGDHAELLRTALQDSHELARRGLNPDVRLNEAERAAVTSLLAENAALRSDNADLREHRITADLLVSTLKADKEEAERKLAEAVGRSDDLLKALEWYGEQARLARLIHSEGDAGRHALADDGGSRARAFIANHETIRIDAFLSKEAERG